MALAPQLQMSLFPLPMLLYLSGIRNYVLVSFLQLSETNFHILRSGESCSLNGINKISKRKPDRIINLATRIYIS